MTDTTSATESSERVAFTGCCPRFQPETFQEGDVVWKDKQLAAARPANAQQPS